MLNNPFNLIKQVQIKAFFATHIKTLNYILKLFFTYLAFVGIFSFGLFLAEEGVQLICWANFSALDTNRHDLVKLNTDTIDRINTKFQVINKYFLWISPFQWWGYESFGKSMDRYVATMNQVVLANEPSLFVGEHIQASFVCNSYKRAQNGLWVWQAGKVKIISSRQPQTGPNHISGIVELDPEKPGGVVIKIK